MTEARVVLLTSMSAQTNKQIVDYAPAGFVTASISNDAPDEEKIAALQDADFLLIHPGTISERVLRSAPKLKLVQLLRVGYELVDLKLLRELGIPFAITGDAFSGIVADHTVLLILAVYRNLVFSDRAVREGKWDQTLWGRPVYEMEDKLVGILGLGNIGKQVAKRVLGFGCKVQYYNRRPLPADQEEQLGVRSVSLRELFVTSDIVTLHVPITAETRHMVGRAELRSMRPSAIIVNTSRGEVINEAALIEALEQRWITGAGLDVFDPQPPLGDSSLLKMDNVVLTPHSASVALERIPRTAQFAWRNVKNVWEGKPPMALVTEE